MAEIANLRIARKRAARRQAAQAADANRLAHGVPAAGRKAQAARRDKAVRDLDWHRIGKGDDR